MENYLYRCKYCGKDFKPKRRRVQKFCSNSCRTRNHQIIKPNKELRLTQENFVLPKVTKIDKISTAGIGNAAIGSGLVEIAKNLLTDEANKPATKGDLKKIANQLERYQLVKNLPFRFDGLRPFFDLETKIIVYKP